MRDLTDNQFKMSNISLIGVCYIPMFCNFSIDEILLEHNKNNELCNIHKEAEYYIYI